MKNAGRTARRRPTLTVGTQFQHNQAHLWTDADGGKHWHSMVTLSEITQADDSSVHYVVREVLEESGRPTTGAMVPTPGKSKGSLSMAGAAAAMKRGSIVLLVADHMVGRAAR